MAVRTRRWIGQTACLVRQRLTFSAVRILLGGILLTAATLKGELLLRSGTWPYDAWGFALVLFELGFAGWLFSGRLPAHVWWVSVACFATFATVTAAKLFRGEADCGCFGVVRTPPWITLLIDIAALTALTATYRDRKAVALHTSTLGYRLPATIGYAVILFYWLRPSSAFRCLPATNGGVKTRVWRIRHSGSGSDARCWIRSISVPSCRRASAWWCCTGTIARSAKKH